MAGPQGSAGQAGAPGAQGPQGIQGIQGESGPDKKLEVREEHGASVNVPAGGSAFARAPCAPDEVVTGGGIRIKMHVIRLIPLMLFPPNLIHNQMNGSIYTLVLVQMTSR